MRTPDLDRERSEKSVSLQDFLKSYNEGLPADYPRASLPLLKEFKETHATFFRADGQWSLDQHRKRVMDWLRSRTVAPITR